MLAGFTGWHVLIILFMVLVLAGLVAVVIIIVRGAAKSGAAAIEPSAAPASPDRRLDELERLVAAGKVTAAEYAEKRAEILGLL
ncbi:hypothetical protein [Agromyces ramosus]|uniref:Nitrogen fixation protein FixH n=1 Tax=Agromyces ramosus TaxID=33879 RepID=A0ABU0R8K5_9MICO|nr:hypothetical protein [Agromyces ramosus]MDQ0894411.1 nitrogen fixation protein FixH [Agromyces ramosus]